MENIMQRDGDEGGYYKPKQRYGRRGGIGDNDIDRHESLCSIFQKKNNSKKKLIETLTPILAEYSQKNSISYIIPKQSIIIGKSELDLTKTILEILNSKIKKIRKNGAIAGYPQRPSKDAIPGSGFFSFLLFCFQGVRGALGRPLPSLNNVIV